MTIPVLPADLLNRALDAIGAGTLIGALSDGTTASEAARRVYGPTLRQLLRAAHWGFARKSAPMLILADVTGQTLDPGTGQPISAAVEPPWTYAYAWPNDGIKARWLPWNGQTGGASVVGAAAAPTSAIPARFLVSSSDQFPAETGAVDWDNLPDLGEGQGPIGRRIILTDVPIASLVYTKLALYPEEWDSLFDEAMVGLLGSRLAIPLMIDHKADARTQLAQRQVAMRAQQQQIAVAKDAIMQARIANANDSGFPQSVSHTPDWITARSGGGRAWGLADWGPGYTWVGWDSVSFADGSVF